MIMKIQKETLPNGLRVITEEIPYVRSASIGVWVGTGSRQESEENNGISHFIEHMLFKGTSHRTARELAETIDSVGGQLNAFTAKEYTCYYAKVLDEHLPVAIELLADMLLNSLFTPEDTGKEKGVVIEEIKMYEDTPDELVHDLFAQAMWQQHPLGRTILGTVEAVNGLTRERVMDYFYSHYTPDNMVVAAAGNLSHQTVVEHVAGALAAIHGSRTAGAEEPPRVSPRVTIRAKDTEQVHLCLGTRGVPQDHDDIYSLYLLNSILGGGSSSRLFQEIRETRGLAYSVYSYQSAYRDAGLFAVYAGVSPRYTDEVLRLILLEFARIKEEGVEPAELSRAKEQVKGNLVLSLESTSNRMSRLGKSELTLGRIITPEEVIDKIEAVKQADLQRLAGEMFDPSCLGLAAIGPLDREIRLPDCL